MPILVDTNVLIDLLTNDPQWADWSQRQLETHEPSGLIINPIVYAELCFGFSATNGVDRLISGLSLAYHEIPRLGLFWAAKAFARYRSKGGRRLSILPDFFVGGHAMATDLNVLTRDANRYRTYFPTVQVLAPE